MHKLWLNFNAIAFLFILLIVLTSSSAAYDGMLEVEGLKIGMDYIDSVNLAIDENAQIAFDANNKLKSISYNIKPILMKLNLDIDEKGFYTITPENLASKLANYIGFPYGAMEIIPDKYNNEYKLFVVENHDSKLSFLISYIDAGKYPQGDNLVDPLLKGQFGESVIYKLDNLKLEKKLNVNSPKIKGMYLGQDSQQAAQTILDNRYLSESCTIKGDTQTQLIKFSGESLKRLFNAVVFDNGFLDKFFKAYKINGHETPLNELLVSKGIENVKSGSDIENSNLPRSTKNILYAALGIDDYNKLKIYDADTYLIVIKGFGSDNVSICLVAYDIFDTMINPPKLENKNLNFD